MDIPDSINIFGLTFHLYGLIIGISLILLWRISEYFLMGKISKNSKLTLFIWMIISALIGARVWHVATQWDLYSNSIVSIFFIWQGGLSIFGALLGGLIGVIVASKVHNFTRGEILRFADAIAIAMPLSQATGRLANWVNEELYGPPTDLPWKIYISEQNRLNGFENQEYFHPLFLYEAIGSLFLGLLLFFLERKSHFKLGQGKILLLYLFGYGVLRFFLDFIRIDKTMISNTNLGLNQFLIFISLFIILAFWVVKWFSYKKLVFGLLLTLGSIMLLLGYFQSQDRGLSMPENSMVKIGKLQIGDDVIKVELADTSEKITKGLSGRTKIGADGMLFMFAEKKIPGFWMIDMKFDLDMVWIRDNKIIFINKNVPAPAEGTPPSQLEIYSPPGLVDIVLEIPAGKSDQYGWKSGDAVDLML